MKLITKICVYCMACMSVIACQKIDSAKLDGEWVVTEIRGEKIEPSEQTPFVGFRVAKGEVYGFTGCNRLTGVLDFGQMADGKTDFSGLGMTRMLCQDDIYEIPFMEAMGAAKVLKMDGADGFVLLDDAENVVVRFQKK